MFLSSFPLVEKIHGEVEMGVDDHGFPLESRCSFLRCLAQNERSPFDCFRKLMP
jgi:hypothetical protein